MQGTQITDGSKGTLMLTSDQWGSLPSLPSPATQTPPSPSANPMDRPPPLPKQFFDRLRSPDPAHRLSRFARMSGPTARSVPSTDVTGVSRRPSDATGVHHCPPDTTGVRRCPRSAQQVCELCGRGLCLHGPVARPRPALAPQCDLGGTAATGQGHSPRWCLDPLRLNQKMPSFLPGLLGYSPGAPRS